MKKHSTQYGFISVGLGLLIFAISGTAALAINSSHSEVDSNTVQEQRQTYDYEYVEVNDPESDV